MKSSSSAAHSFASCSRPFSHPPKSLTPPQTHICFWVHSLCFFHPLRSVPQQQLKLCVNGATSIPSSSVSTPHKFSRFSSSKASGLTVGTLLPSSFQQGHNGGGPLCLPRTGGGTVCREGKTGPSLSEVVMLFCFLSFFLWGIKCRH